MSKLTCSIIAGPNGAGKTTFALDYLSKTLACKRFINADLIASGLSPLSPESEQIKSSRIFLNEIKEAINRQECFAFETTLSGRTYVKLIKNLQEKGWEVNLIYLYLPSVKVSIERVSERVKHGGHNIPKEAILRRYPRSLKNLIELYSPLCDTTVCIENAGKSQKIIFTQELNNKTIQDKQSYQELLGDIAND